MADHAGVHTYVCIYIYRFMNLLNWSFVLFIVRVLGFLRSCFCHMLCIYIYVYMPNVFVC